MLGYLLSVVATAVVFATSAQAALVGRDINGNAVAGDHVSSVFLYDTDRNITWLRNANAGAGSSFDSADGSADGRMTWGNAVGWAGALTVGIFDDWRLPTVTDTGTSGCDFSYAGGTDCGYNVNTATGEMAHLFYDELGNLAACPPGDADCFSVQVGFGLANVGDFLNMQSNVYWSGTEYAPSPVNAWYFYPSIGTRDTSSKNDQFYAMAVRPGDVLAAQVPEPESLLLALTALSALALVRRRRAVGTLVL